MAQFSVTAVTILCLFQMAGKNNDALESQDAIIARLSDSDSISDEDDFTQEDEEQQKRGSLWEWLWRRFSFGY